MLKWKGNKVDNIGLVASEITRSAALTDEESEEVVSSPQFFSVLRAEIDREKQRRQAVPIKPIAPAIVLGKMKVAFSALMIIAAVTFWLLRIPTLTRRNSEESRSEEGPGLTACSLSATSACAITTGDVLQLLISDNVQELPK